MTLSVSIPGEDQVLTSLSVTQWKVVDVEGDLAMSSPPTADPCRPCRMTLRNDLHRATVQSSKTIIRSARTSFPNRVTY